MGGAVFVRRAALVIGLAGAPFLAWAQQDDERPGAGRPEGPPPEAVEACQGQAEGDECRFESPRGEMSGTCRTPPRQEVLACVPRGHRRPDGRQGDSEGQGGRRTP